MHDIVKSKEPQERKSSLALSLYFKKSFKNMEKEKNAHFLLGKGVVSNSTCLLDKRMIF